MFLSIVPFLYSKRTAAARSLVSRYGRLNVLWPLRANHSWTYPLKAHIVVHSTLRLRPHEDAQYRARHENAPKSVAARSSTSPSTSRCTLPVTERSPPALSVNVLQAESVTRPASPGRIESTWIAATSAWREPLMVQPAASSCAEW